ncbi:MAG TPA: hypothetical protein VNX70_03125 [Bryobacteraceae bacterium]|nr:hypothetical protein [Bryobacteraceae bacterium]
MNKNRDLTAIAHCLLEYVEDLLTTSPKESFSKVEMLVLLNAVKNDRQLMALLGSYSQSTESSPKFA